MAWLTQIGIWSLLAIAALFLFRDWAHGGPGPRRAHGHARRNEDGVQRARAARSNSPDMAIDPVNGEPVRTDRALTTLYRGSIYHFASSKNRDRFEAAPWEYARNAAGQRMSQAGTADSRGRRGF